MIKNIFAMLIVFSIFVTSVNAADIYVIKDDQQIGTLRLENMISVIKVVRDGDKEALILMLEQERAINLAPDMEVYVSDFDVENLEFPGMIIKCRKKGTTIEFYCPKWAIKKKETI